jgi:outer membrane receptor protein involved in Fe transport
MQHACGSEAATGSSHAKGHQGRDMQAFLIVDNLLDQAPRVSPSTSSTTPGGGLPAVVGDDTTGRYYTAGLRFKF